MPKLVLVDGSSYLYRAYHALPDLRTSKGEPTGALRGVLSMLRRMVEDGKPDYFAVVFDAPGKTFRDAWYPEYKANRTAMPDELCAQLAPLQEVVRAAGWPLLIVDNVEADDVIGTLAKRAKVQGIDTLISTSDKDMAQLVERCITCVNTMSNDVLDVEGVVAKFGVRPDQVLDLLALTGDAVDNVPGVPKVGIKTAAKWLNEFGTLDAIIANADRIGGVVGENLRQTLDWLPTGKKILTIRVDCDLAVEPTDLKLTQPDETRLVELLTRFEFKTWLKERGGMAATGIAPTKTSLPPSLPEMTGAGKPSDLRYETVLDAATLSRWLADVEGAELVTLGVETDSLDPMTMRIVGVSFAIEPGNACYVPLAHRYTGAPEQLDRDAALAQLRPWIESPRPTKLCHNVKFVQHVLANHGLALAGIAHDTMLEDYVLESHKPNDLESLALRQLDWKKLAYVEVCGKGVGQICFDQVSVERGTEYAGEDVDVTLRLHHGLHPRVAADDGLDHVYGGIELPLREVLFRMERHGVLIDARVLGDQGRELGARVNALEASAFALAGAPFNLGSPKQLAEILFTQLKLPVVKKTATGQPSTDEDVLQELAQDYPLPKVILEHRSLAKLKSTYTDKLPQMVNAATGRVHTTFAQATAVTGRLASTEPNLQNIPIRTAEGRRIREAFIAPPAHVLASADYSQVELRIMAHLSGDASLVDAFNEGGDIHRTTAADIFGVAPHEVSADQRRYIKAVNFGLIYGMSAFGLSQQLSIERSAAAQFIDKYFQRYPGVAVYMQRTRELARERGYVETVFGRRLWLPDIRAASGPRRAGAERAAINAPMQGTAADLIKLAMIAVQAWLDEARLGTRLVLQVHDELVFEVPEHEIALVREELPVRMTGVAKLSVPLVVDVGFGANWERAH